MPCENNAKDDEYECCPIAVPLNSLITVTSAQMDVNAGEDFKS